MNTSKFSKEQIEAILEDVKMLLSFAPPGKYLDALHEIYHVYIISEHDHLPVDFKGYAERMYILLLFLKNIGKTLNDKE